MSNTDMFLVYLKVAYLKGTLILPKRNADHCINMNQKLVLGLNQYLNSKKTMKRSKGKKQDSCVV